MEMLDNLPEVTYFRAWAINAIAQTRARERDERGEIISWVIMAAIVAGATIVIVTLVMNKFKDKANTIPTE